MHSLTIHATSYYLRIIGAADFNSFPIKFIKGLKPTIFYSIKRNCELFGIEGYTKHQIPIRVTNLILDLMFSAKQNGFQHNIEHVLAQFDKCIDSCLNNQQDLL